MYSQVNTKAFRLSSDRAETTLDQITRTSYPSRLSFYEISPDLEISIEEFETFALDRLKVLKEVELAYIRGPTPKDIQKRIIEVSAKYLNLSGRKHKNINVLMSERRKDYVSHFILRLSFSRTEELRMWLVKQESLLFKARFAEFDMEDRELFFKYTNLDLIPVLDKELKDLEAYSQDFWRQELYYKVKFEKALDLVVRRKVVVKAGYAYVPSSELVTLLTEDFKTRLSDSMIICSRSLPRLEGDDRLLPVLQNMSAQYNVSEYQSTGAAGEITANDIEKLSKYFPPCMINLQVKLKESSHLKYGGRLQYGLFLKGIGLKLPEALQFWRLSFSKKFSEDKFNKEYAYNIRHSYGMEGKRANYSPYSCTRIITQNQPSSGDNHGCPFRHFSPNRLKHFLSGVTDHSSTQSSDPQISEIVELAKNNHYQVACTRFLELQISNRREKNANTSRPSNPKTATTFVNDQASGSPQVAIEGISHPNAYFDINIANSSLAAMLKPQ